MSNAALSWNENPFPPHDLSDMDQLPRPPRRDIHHSLTTIFYTSRNESDPLSLRATPLHLDEPVLRHLYNGSPFASDAKAEPDYFAVKLVAPYQLIKGNVVASSQSLMKDAMKQFMANVDTDKPIKMNHTFPIYLQSPKRVTEIETINGSNFVTTYDSNLIIDDPFATGFISNTYMMTPESYGSEYTDQFGVHPTEHIDMYLENKEIDVFFVDSIAGVYPLRHKITFSSECNAEITPTVFAFEAKAEASKFNYFTADEIEVWLGPRLKWNRELLCQILILIPEAKFIRTAIVNMMSYVNPGYIPTVQPGYCSTLTPFQTYGGMIKERKTEDATWKKLVPFAVI